MALARCVPPLISQVRAICNRCTFSSDLSNHTVTGLNLASWKKRRKLLLLDEKVFVKMRHNRELVGVLHGFDSHLNLILGNVDETLTTLELDEETYEEIYKKHSSALCPRRWHHPHIPTTGGTMKYPFLCSTCNEIYRTNKGI
ncbi:u6 snRNA associated Sm protein LSm3 [Echinococcus multilocularis]|uniref:U6 snRNA associated Sm protein LSm3 n=1 Tax=Echinococcus multilocularis TaxID=6211 RepID=A0A068YI12_ECHMU|nr:u6 snRNA associated Sm protein LSm3 [Echinococcus multilocularis]